MDLPIGLKLPRTTYTETLRRWLQDSYKGIPAIFLPHYPTHVALILRAPTGPLFLLREDSRLTLPSLPVLYADTATRTARRLTDSIVGLHSVGGLLAPLEGRTFHASQ